MGASSPRLLPSTIMEAVWCLSGWIQESEAIVLDKLTKFAKFIRLDGRGAFVRLLTIQVFAKMPADLLAIGIWAAHLPSGQ